jgi:hypothetical protein
LALRGFGTWGIFLAGLVAFTTLAFGLLWEPAMLLGEGGVVERGTALGFLAAAVTFGMAAFREGGRVRAFALFWMLLSIFCAGEETSWLQHELGYATPKFIADINVQAEFNLHNLRGLHGGKLLEADEETPLLGAPFGSQNLFQLGFVIYFLIIPLLALLPRVRQFLVRVGLPFLSFPAVLTIWIPIAAAMVLTLLGTRELKQLAAEIRELHYALGFLLLSFWLMRMRAGSSLAVQRAPSVPLP